MESKILFTSVLKLTRVHIPVNANVLDFVILVLKTCFSIIIKLENRKKFEKMM